MTTHTITLARHTAQVVDLMGALVLGTWDSYGTEQLLLRPGPEWDSLAIDATFHNTPSDEGVTMLADTDGLVPVPPEACKQPSKYATITFRGVQDGVQRISCNLPYMVLDHAQVPGANSTATPADYVDAADGYGQAHAKMSSITVKWDDNASASEKMERLMVQKWIALFPDGQEAWSEIRRTGYPKVFPSAQSTAYDLTVPNRLPFDYMEPVNNPDNYQKAVQLLGGPDTYATKMWWQK